jgi:membrane peptidoglycan carboxypeptidase
MGKTGTTDGSYQNWLIGSTTKAAIAVWVGNIQGDPTKKTAKNPGGEQSLRRVTIAGTNGANVKFIVFKAMLQSFNANPAYRGGDFPDPDPTLVNGKRSVQKPSTSTPTNPTPTNPTPTAPTPTTPAPPVEGQGRKGPPSDKNKG